MSFVVYFRARWSEFKSRDFFGKLAILADIIKIAGISVVTVITAPFASRLYGFHFTFGDVLVAVFLVGSLGWLFLPRSSPSSRARWKRGGKAKASAFYLVHRLHALGWNSESPRLMLAVPRGGFHGMMIWFEVVESRESPEARAMKSALADQGYEVVTARVGARLFG